MYTPAGVARAFFGALLGKAMDGEKLLFLFALLMLIVGMAMFRGCGDIGTSGVACNREKTPKVVGYGRLIGMLLGFFDIGGGFLIVLGLVASTGMSMLDAINSSLVAVTAFDLKTEISYAFSGFVDWPMAAVFVAGGV